MLRQRLGIAVFVLLGLPLEGTSQDEVTQQFWADFNFDYPFAIQYRARMQVGRQELLSGGDPWKSTVFWPSLEYYPIPFFDIIGGFRYSYTDETNEVDTYEYRPVLGFRLNFLQQKLILRNRTLYEYRSIHYVDSAVTNSSRLRIRVELVAPFNNPNTRDPKTLYGLTDIEYFIDLDEPVGERFANRWRWRAGLGWRFNIKWRVEFIYALQKSRDTLSDNSETTDNIYRIRLKFQLQRSHPEIDRHVP